MARPNRGLRLEKNDRGIYEIRWSEDGRSKRRSTGSADASEAADALRVWKQGVSRQHQVDSAGTVRGVLDAYMREHVYKNVVGVDTAEKCQRYLLAHFADMAPAEMMPADVREYARLRMTGTLVVGHEDGKPVYCQQVQGSSVRRELVVLVAAMSHAVAEKRLARGDMPSIPLPPSNPPKERWLTEPEVRLLLDRARGADERWNTGRMPRIYRFVMLAYYTAGRKSALQGLRWSQVDWTYGDTGGVDLAIAGARVTNKRRAKVPMSAALRTMMERAYIERESEFVLDHDGNIRRSFETLAAAAGLEDVTPHVLRHTAATHMLRRGVPMWLVAGVLGDSEATVRKVYGKHVPEALRQAVEALL
jgi:integrase